VIVLAVRWYLRFGLSYRDVEELLAERGVEVDHVTIYRWVQRFTPLLADAARPCRHAVGDRWFVDETYLKIGGRWRYLYRAVDQFGQVIDVYISPRRDTEAAHRFFDRAIRATRITPVEVVTDKAAAYPRVLDERVPAAWHGTEKYANNRIEADHGQLKRRLRPMRRPEDRRRRPGDHGRTRLRAERPPRPLRPRRRPTRPTACRGGVCRTCRGDLTPMAARGAESPRRGRRQRNNALPDAQVWKAASAGSRGIGSHIQRSSPVRASKARTMPRSNVAARLSPTADPTTTRPPTTTGGDVTPYSRVSTW
jgi:transposase-like protein